MAKIFLNSLHNLGFVRGLFFIFSIAFLSSCTSSSQKPFKVMATAVPHAQMLEFIQPELKAQGIDLEILITDDYQTPNRALADKEIDANFFQHLPFLKEQVYQFHYSLESAAAVEIEPMGIYSKKIHSLLELKNKATIAIPNDPSNEGRALLFLEAQGLIQLDHPENLLSTVLNIISNPKQLQFLEIDAAMLPRSLEDVDAALINTNYALQAHLSPSQDALALEGKDSPYVNIIAIRTGEESRPEIHALVTEMTSPKMKDFILKTYKGAVLPSF